MDFALMMAIVYAIMVMLYGKAYGADLIDAMRGNYAPPLPRWSERWKGF